MDLYILRRDSVHNSQAAKLTAYTDRQDYRLMLTRVLLDWNAGMKRMRLGMRLTRLYYALWTRHFIITRPWGSGPCKTTKQSPFSQLGLGATGTIQY